MINLTYIASPSFSGSTLLTLLLNQHPSIATVGELKWGNIDLETYRCSCGQLLRQCDFWRKVELQMHARGLPFDLNRPLTDFRCRDHRFADRIVRARIRGSLFETVRNAAVARLTPCRQSWTTIERVNRAMMEIVLHIQEASIFLDASKDPVRLQHLKNTGDYNIRIIQLIRDGRAVTNSAIKNEKVSASIAAREWVRTHRQIERLGGRLGFNRIFTLRYEDLCLAPLETLNDIFDFLGLDTLDEIMDYQSVEHHILGNRMRLRHDSEIQLDEKWQTRMSQTELAVFERVGGRLNKQYYYARDTYGL